MGTSILYLTVAVLCVLGGMNFVEGTDETPTDSSSTATDAVSASTDEATTSQSNNMNTETSASTEGAGTAQSGTATDASDNQDGGSNATPSSTMTDASNPQDGGSNTEPSGTTSDASNNQNGGSNTTPSDTTADGSNPQDGGGNAEESGTTTDASNNQDGGSNTTMQASNNSTSGSGHQCLVCEGNGTSTCNAETADSSSDGIDTNGQCQSCRIVKTDAGKDSELVQISRACNTSHECPTNLKEDSDFFCREVNSSRVCEWCCTGDNCNNYNYNGGNALVVGLIISGWSSTKLIYVFSSAMALVMSVPSVSMIG